MVRANLLRRSAKPRRPCARCDEAGLLSPGTWREDPDPEGLSEWRTEALSSGAPRSAGMHGSFAPRVFRSSGNPDSHVAELNQVETSTVQYFAPCQTFLNEQDLDYMTDLDVDLTLLNMSYINYY